MLPGAAVGARGEAGVGVGGGMGVGVEGGRGRGGGEMGEGVMTGAGSEILRAVEQEVVGARSSRHRRARAPGQDVVAVAAIEEVEAASDQGVVAVAAIE